MIITDCADEKEPGLVGGEREKQLIYTEELVESRILSVICTARTQLHAERVQEGGLRSRQGAVDSNQGKQETNVSLPQWAIVFYFPSNALDIRS